jgi:hypothetical protein
MKICKTFNLSILTSLIMKTRSGYSFNNFQHAHPVSAIVCKLSITVYRQITIYIKYIGIIGIYQHF